VKLPTVLEAAANFGEVLGIVIAKIDELRDPERRSRLYLRSSLGRTELGPDGLVIESMNSRMRAKFGIEEDDIIKAVNGRTMRDIQDVAAAFSAFTGEPQTVTVMLVRDEEEFTLTYYIR
jgi:S1-C subfamily serine protease